MTLSEELQWRGQIKDKTFEDVKWLDQPKTFYLGVDCSSDSMTIGNLAVFMTARRLLDAGWKTVLLVGGATSLIGDPGGKENERDLKTREEIQANVAGIKAQVQRLFADKEFTLVDNYDWFKDVGYLEFLRDVGKHYSMTELLQRDFIATRIGESGSGISYAEFSYSLIQGYDYWHLNKKYGVELQLGGSDQWGNMLSGVPLIRKRENTVVHALSTPLVINKTTGVKFGKSEDGAVWLDEKRTSPYKFYQFWLNVDDEGVEEYLKIYTLLTKDEIEKIMVAFEHGRADRLAQKTLAYEVTKLVHGKDAADSVVRITKALFSGGDLAEISSEDVDQMKSELPTVKAKDGDLVLSTVVESGLATSQSEARRFMEQGGISLNGQKVGLEYALTQDDRKVAGSALLRRGKNNYAIIDIHN
jgi:tyrosyl-tRNA synthetase